MVYNIIISVVNEDYKIKSCVIISTRGGGPGTELKNVLRIYRMCDPEVPGQ